jgi:hypothetical protein
MKNRQFYLFIIFLLTAGCSKDNPVSSISEQIVVRGYLFTGEPVQDIQLTEALPLGSNETSAPPINSAVVKLVKEGKEYSLITSEGDSGYYYYPGNDLSVDPGDVFAIQIDYLGNTIFAETTVPAPPEEVTISADTLVITNMGEFPFNGDFESDSLRWLTVSWKEDASSLFYVTMENIEENPEAVDSDNQFFQGGGNMRYVSSPSSRNEYQVNRMEINYYGKHRLRVYRVNQEYADLYETRQQDSRDLNEPLTNIVNGLGIFSAFSSVDIFFIAVKDE